jgi:DNA-binding NtrC family response regulator
MKIIIYNDELRSEMQMYLMLSNLHDVMVAQDMGDLLQLLDQTEADLTFLDLTVRQDDGGQSWDSMDIAHKIRHRFPHLKVIGIYDQGDSTVLRRAEDNGITDFITRPIKNRELLQLVES